MGIFQGSASSVEAWLRPSQMSKRYPCSSSVLNSGQKKKVVIKSAIHQEAAAVKSENLENFAHNFAISILSFEAQT